MSRSIAERKNSGEYSPHFQRFWLHRELLYTQYDYFLGRPVNTQDVNGSALGLVSSIAYNDALDRPTEIVRGANLTGTAREKNRTLFTYNDSAHLITSQSDLNNFQDGLLKGETMYDGLGRTVETRKYESTTAYIKSTVTYDALGRTEYAYNPHRQTTEETYGSIKTTYDALSRIVSVQSFDRSGISTGTVQTAYSGNQVLVTDQAGKQRMSRTDALGRLVDVWEIKSADSATESVAFPGHPEVTAGYRTSYTYDALDSLLTATQRVGASGTTQTRTFEYDSLKRLTRATNPENGVVLYQYDNNGNLIEKTDTNQILYYYDALNRLIQKRGAVAEADYYYDNQTLPFTPSGYARGSSIGRLVAVTSQSYFGIPSQRPFATFYGYDKAGRTSQSYQRIDGQDYGFTNITYNRADEQTEVTYPSLRKVSTSYDGAGRTATLSTEKNSFTISLAGTILYSPSGALSSEVYGNGLTHAISYNSRFQPTSIRLGSGGDTGSIFNLTYLYGQLANPTDADSSIDGTKNNGNIARTRLYWDGAQQYSNTYRYDQLNRIQDYVLHLEGVNDTTHEYLKEVYQYDRFGNRGMDNSVSTSWGPPLSYFNAANNRITGAGYRYDSRGNLTGEPIPGGTTIAKNYTYNAENKILTFNTSTNTYDYDGDARRVKIKNSLNQTTRMVYNAAGQLIAEYDAGTGSLKKEYIYRSSEMLATIDADGTVKFGTTDHLGSVREWTYLNGNLVEDGTHDYMPFGTDLYYGEQRDGQRQQFTSKERDNDTGLDYFGARYSSSVQGRFISPDEFTGGPTELFADVAAHNPMFYADIADPQSLNKYTYALNSPLKYVDPDGHQATVSDVILAEVGKGILKSIGNVFIGMSNAGLSVVDVIQGREVPRSEYLQPSNIIQEYAIGTTEKELIISGGLGRGTAGIITSESRQTAIVAAEMRVGEAAAGVMRKAGGALTEPKLPPKTVVDQNGVKIVHYTASGDHGPAHLHVKGQGNEVRIGQNGKPLKNNPELSATQQRVVNDNKSTIRKSVDKIQRYHRFHNSNDEMKK